MFQIIPRTLSSAGPITDGRQIVIEMQKRTPDDLKNRLFYYGSALIYTQLKRGDDTYRLIPVYILIFLDGNLNHMNPADKRLVYRYRMQEQETGEVYGINCRSFAANCRTSPREATRR